MSATVRLNDIINALDMQLDEFSSFLDCDTGQVETVSDAILQEAEAGDDKGTDVPVWQQQEWETARRIVSAPNRFRNLPTKFDVHEWAIMEDFSRSIESDRIREELYSALQAPGPSAILRTPCGGTASKQRGLRSERKF